MTLISKGNRHARESGHPGDWAAALLVGPWIPAFAGMTIERVMNG
jgi:hypothetical protein